MCDMELTPGIIEKGKTRCDCIHPMACYGLCIFADDMCSNFNVPCMIDVTCACMSV